MVGLPFSELLPELDMMHLLCNFLLFSSSPFKLLPPKVDFKTNQFVFFDGVFRLLMGSKMIWNSMVQVGNRLSG